MREKLQTLSLVVLREFAKDKKIKGITAMRKAELIDAIIEAHQGHIYYSKSKNLGGSCFTIQLNRINRKTSTHL